MKLNPCKDIPNQQLTPTAMRKLLTYDDNNMFLYMECKKGTKQPKHSHPHKQIDYIIDGEIEFACGDEVKIVKSGDVVEVPPNVPHAFKDTIKDTRWIEFFTPIRQDIIDDMIKNK